ncbi:MAG: hypothetical protein CVU84_03570 [Firmicutes bacterium HGW-Firmicutes-1]|jgi:epoxyqueuosine reductase|nr:MAG: hypothetical protein CVU84_03570 [Firmicutes bacterium HGW-Firmicutes-1]
MNINQSIIQYAKEISIDKIGFCRANTDLERNQLKGAQSFIVILESYNLYLTNEKSTILHGKMSKAAIFEDYHKIVNRKLELLQRFLSDGFHCNSKLYCDTSLFSDRSLAVRAGLGVIGKNTFLINEDYGTATFIGYLLTDMKLEYYDSEIRNDYCEGCSICLNACPSKAIGVDKQFHIDLCISKLTQAKEVPEELKKLMSNSLYGCDICQLACPSNHPKNKNSVKESIIEEYYDLDFLLSMNNAIFKDTIGKTAAGWKGKKTLQRNGIIALGNHDSQESVRILNKFYQDIRIDIRMEIVHSLGRIGSIEAKQVLKEKHATEKNEEVRLLIHKYL